MKGNGLKHRNLSPSSLKGRGFYVPGKIRKRGRSYVLKVYAGRQNGKKRDKWLTFRTHQEAEAFQRELSSHTLAHSAGVGLFGSPSERLGPYLTDWIKRQKQRLAPGTYVRYESIVAQIRKDVIGATPYARLTPRTLEHYYARKLDALAPATVRYHHAVLRKALQDAMRQEMVLRNPAALAVAPRLGKTEREVWTEAQTLLFLSEAKASSRFFPVYLFAATTGARQGEVLGLPWRELDLDGRVARITQNLQWLRGGGHVLRQPKTAGSRRPITLSPEVVGDLRALRTQQDHQRSQHEPCSLGTTCRNKYCRRWHETGLVFTLPNGKPIHKRNMHHDLKGLCLKLGLPWRRAFHGWRHGHHSHLLERGVNPKVVQERGGWSSTAFFLSVYAHVMPGAQEQAAQAVSNMLKGLK